MLEAKEKKGKEQKEQKEQKERKERKEQWFHESDVSTNDYEINFLPLNNCS